ncbi:hypothetical protein D3C84_930770 [compost metagenome]
MLQLTVNHITRHTRHRTGDVADQQRFLLFSHQAEQRAGMTVVISVLTVVVTIGGTIEGQRRLCVTRRLLRRLDIAVRLVVRCRTAIAAKSHRTITLVTVDRTARSIDWQLLVIGADTVAMSVRVGEDPTLQHTIR